MSHIRFADPTIKTAYVCRSIVAMKWEYLFIFIAFASNFIVKSLWCDDFLISELSYGLIFLFS